VNEQLVEVVKEAITLTKIDFGVSEGLRTLEKQKELVAKGASKTMKSKHLTGHAVDLVAVDLVAYLGDRISWEMNLYDDIADAMKTAAMVHDVKIRWGAAWHIDDIADWDGTMQEATDAYVELRRSQGRRPFIDGPHFELN
jgi:peptidoglycan L-alanyl-D-glutamate endopeptidase CwlK